MPAFADQEEPTMPSNKLNIVDGPDKPALQLSLTKPGECFVHFHLENDAVDAEILRMEEGADGFTFELQGRLTSGQRKGEPFDALYSIGTRSGWLRVTPKGETRDGQM
jgi:hypothetical protein